MESVDLRGKTVIVTGPTAGIGKETARELARRGARVILACRNPERGDVTLRDIVEDTRNENVVIKLLDLSSLKSVRAFAEDFNQTEDRLDMLINNAGLITKERRESADGYELQFATNHLGHFLLTILLLDKLKASSPSRIINVSSDAHRRGKLDFKDLQVTHGYSAFKAYGRTKSANILFTVELAKRLEGTGVTAYSLHPGVVKTEFAREYTWMQNACCQCLISCLVCCFTCSGYLTPSEGALTTLYCALEPSLANTSGRYYSDSKEKSAARHAMDPQTAAQLWEVSEMLTGLRENTPNSYQQI